MNRIFIRQVDPTVASLNHGDSFVLDPLTGRKLYVWIGSSSSMRERKKSLWFARKLNDEQSGLADVLIICTCVLFRLIQ